MKKQKLANLILLVIFGVIMFISKMIMEFLPNIHLVGVLIAVFTLVYRHRALISIYVYAFLVGFIYGFSTWWYPYLYIWTVLWLLIMLIPKKAPFKLKIILATFFCAIHGLSYGTLYAPFQALAFGLSFEGMIAWIVVGFPWDIVHMCGNLALSVLISPLYRVLIKLGATHAKATTVRKHSKRYVESSSCKLVNINSGSNEKRYLMTKKSS